MQALLPFILPMLLKALANPENLAKIAAWLQNIGGQPAPAAPVDTGDEPLVKYDMRWLQESLNTLLGENNPVTGKSNAATRTAIIKYQKLKGEDVLGKADGWAGLKTMVAIVADLEARKK